MLGIFTIIMLISRVFKIFNHIHAVSRPTIGEELLPIGFIAAYLLTDGQSNLFVPAVLITGIADPITGIVMERFRNHALGMLVFTCITVPILMLYIGIPLLPALLLGLSIATIERISPFGTDNLTVPLATTLLVTYV